MIPMLELLPDPQRPVYKARKAATKRVSRLGSKIFGPHFPQGSVARTAVYLIMSHDSKYLSTFPTLSFHAHRNQRQSRQLVSKRR